MANHQSPQNPVLTFSELGLVHCLGTAGIPVFTASEKERSVASYSRYSQKHIKFSDYNTENFIDELCEFGASLDEKAVLMSHDDRAILNISKRRERLKKYFLFRLPKAEMVEKLLDKLLFVRLCEEYNLPAPASIEISKMAELENAKKLRPPYIIKPAYKHYWYHDNFEEIVGHYKKAFICQTLDELELLYAKISQIHPDAVIQEYVVGEDRHLYDVNLHVTAGGEIDGYVIGQKMRVYPPKAGWGSYVRTVFDDEMIDICREIITKLELRGMVNIQFKRDERTQKPKLIEIHTRTSIFDFLGASAGQNIPSKYYSNLTGLQGKKSESYKSDITYINLARDLRLLARYRKEYQLSLMDWLKSYSNVSVYDGMILKDPKGFYHELLSTFTR